MTEPKTHWQCFTERHLAPLDAEGKRPHVLQLTAAPPARPTEPAPRTPLGIVLERRAADEGKIERD